MSCLWRCLSIYLSMNTWTFLLTLAALSIVFTLSVESQIFELTIVTYRMSCPYLCIMYIVHCFNCQLLSDVFRPTLVCPPPLSPAHLPHAPFGPCVNHWTASIIHVSCCVQWRISHCFSCCRCRCCIVVIVIAAVVVVVVVWASMRVLIAIVGWASICCACACASGYIQVCV